MIPFLEMVSSKVKDMATSFRLVLPFALAGFSGSVLAQTRVVPDPCARTAEMQVYSDVTIQKETGDLLGYELAIQRHGDSDAEALLYVYEGGGAGDGIPLSGQLSNHRLTLKGTWVEHGTEYPSRKEVVEKHSVEVLGTLDSATFRGELTISGMEEHQHVRLRRGKRIWPCKSRNAHSPV
jgi:hypothetical protein